MSVDIGNLVLRSIHDRLGKPYELLNHDLYLFGALDWLMRSQDMSDDGGASAQYDLLHGWDDSYIETSGYILVSFFKASKWLNDPSLFDRAVRMADFLLKVQMPSGAFASGTPKDLPYIPRVFNTGEDIRGLVSAYRETKQSKYLKAAVKAANWLVSIQEADGSWVKDEFQGRKHTYHSRTAWALLQVWEETKDKNIRKSAIDCLDWVVGKQQTNGWFSDCDFTSPPDPFTHAIDYVISGLYESGQILNQPKYIESAKLAADRLLGYYQKHGFMPATFRSDWTSSDSYACLTGNAQIVLSWLQLYSRTREKKYFIQAGNLLQDIKKTVDLYTNDLNIRGAVAGAYPIYGGYSRFNYPNWATKFFFDALLLYREPSR